MCVVCERREVLRLQYRQRTAGRKGKRWTRPLSPPLDEIAVERAMAGDPGEMSAIDCYEAVRRLTEQGLSAREIGQRLRITQRSVVRWRHRPQPVEKPCVRACGEPGDETDSDDAVWTQGTNAA